ncbi:AAA family ATPase, partial [Natrinema altunense]
GEIRIIAATNRFDMLDRAILRPGRFDRLIEVPEPDRDGREQILSIHTRGMNIADGVDFAALADDTDGYSGADIESLATEAGMFAIRNDRDEVAHQDFADALEKIEEDDSSDVVSSAGYFYQ